MTCEEKQLLLPDFSRGKLPDELSSEVNVHLSECTDCRGEAEQFKLLFETLDELQPNFAPATAYWSTLLPRIHNRLGEKGTVLFPAWVQRFALPTAAAVVVALFLMKVIPLSSTNQFPEFQSVIEQFGQEELQEIVQQQTITGAIEPVLRNEQVITSEADTKVVQDLLTTENGQQTIVDLDNEILLQSLDDQRGDDLLAILEHTNAN